MAEEQGPLTDDDFPLVAWGVGKGRMAHLVRFSVALGDVLPTGTACGRKSWATGDYPMPQLADEPHCAKCEARLEETATAYHVVETYAELERIVLASKLRWLHEYEAAAVYNALRYLDLHTLERSNWRWQEIQRLGLLPDVKQFVVAGVIPLDSYDEVLLENDGHDSDCHWREWDDCECGWLKHLEEHPEEYAPREHREIVKATNPQDALMRCSIRRELWDRLAVMEAVADTHAAAVAHWQATGHECTLSTAEAGQGDRGRCLVCGWAWVRLVEAPEAGAATLETVTAGA